MKIREAIEKGITRVIVKIGTSCEKGYLKIPKKGKFGLPPFAQYFSDEYQLLLGLPIPQYIFLPDYPSIMEEACEEYKGKLSSRDVDDGEPKESGLQ